MKAPITCCKCAAILPANKHAVMVGWEWFCVSCAPVVHPQHERDAGVAVRVALMLALAVLVVGLAVLWVREQP